MNILKYILRNSKSVSISITFATVAPVVTIVGDERGGS